MTETTAAGEQITDPHLILDRMAQIVDNDMLVRGDYVENEVTRPDLAESGAICGGHRACAIGSLWIAGGLDPENAYVKGTPDPFAYDRRETYLSDKPALRRAHAALCSAAEDYGDRRDLFVAGDAFWPDPLEALFETGEDDDGPINPRELLTVIDMAREILVANGDPRP